MSDTESGWIIDGFPRSIGQARLLVEEILIENDQHLDRVIHLNISDEVCRARMIRRARPLFPGSTELHDSPERIDARLKAYRNGEREIIPYFRQHGVLLEVNGDQSVEAVHQEILGGLRDINNR